MSSDRWRPPLPSVMRLGGVPVAEIINDDLVFLLKEYYTDRRSVSDIFECRIAPAFMQRAGLRRTEGRFLSEFTPPEQCHLLLKNLWYKASENFRMKLRINLQKRNGLSKVRQWYHTANGVVLPFLITQGVDYKAIDHLTRWCLESCANNYAQFMRDFKTLKKRLRKAFALGRNFRVPANMRTYSAYFYKVKDFDSPQAWGRYVLVWTQTRAVGLADGKMVNASIDKWVTTVTTPSSKTILDPSVLKDTLIGALGADGKHARISVGSTACMESTRQNGGKSAFLASLAKRPVLKSIFNPVDLHRIDVVPRPVRCSRDVVYWAIQEAINKPTYSRCVRLHAVAEPGKARTITVAPYHYQVIMGTFAHVFQKTLRHRGVQSGLTKDRHLWRFLSDILNPQDKCWETLRNGEVVWGLSTDFSEATDFGDPYVARQVWMQLIQLASVHTAFPKGMAALAMNLYCGKRHAFVPVGSGKYKLVTTSRGWFMGDMMTKVILTCVHDYTMRKVGITIYSLVGDDEVSLHNDRARLKAHLDEVEKAGLKISADDTFISRRLLFYCEEGALVPQKPTDSLHVAMRRAAKIGYLDYPRIRLLLAESCETDSYSMTNIGRFALLGKETRWCQAVNPDALRYFEIATLLQHIIVPQDSDTLCPFTPLEIGGDGGYLNDPVFLRRVVDDKSRDPREVKYRMSSLMDNTFNYKFVRSERHNEVVHKHHLLLPALRELAKYLPEESIVRPKDETQRALIESIKVRGLENPQSTWLRLCRGFYYSKIFQGETPLEPKFDIVRKFSDGSTSDPIVNVEEFLRHWANPGFRFSNKEEFFVIRDLVETVDPLSLNWKWSDIDLVRYPTAYEQYSNYIRDEVDFNSQSFDDVMNNIIRNVPLPDRIMKRLNLFMESDNYILSMLPKKYMEEYAIVTRDFKLCAEVRKRLAGADKSKPPPTVWAVDPNVYLTGGISQIEGFEFIGVPKMHTEHLVEDPGAILHVDYTEFQDGFPLWEGIWDSHTIVKPHRYHRGVAIVQYCSCELGASSHYAKWRN